MKPSERRRLWGGAASAIFPDGFTFFDLSKIRDVPNHQEVFVEANQNSNVEDSSIIFEVAELPIEHCESGETLLEFCWKDYCTETEVLEHRIFDKRDLQMPSSMKYGSLTDGFQCAQINGFHFASVNKHQFDEPVNKNNVVPNELVKPIVVSLAIVRFPKVNLNILIFYHLPLEGVFPLENIDFFIESQLAQLNLQKCTQVNQLLVETFEIHDWAVFLTEDN